MSYAAECGKKGFRERSLFGEKGAGIAQSVVCWAHCPA